MKGSSSYKVEPNKKKWVLKSVQKRNLVHPDQFPPLQLDMEQNMLKILDRCIGTWSQISNIFIVHKKDTRMGLFLSNQCLIVLFDHVLYDLLVSLSITLNVWEAVVQRNSVKKVFLEISQNSQENTCVRASFLIKLQALVYRKSEIRDPGP